MSGFNTEQKSRNNAMSVRSEAVKEMKKLSQSVAIPKERQYKVSLQEMVNSSKKCQDEWGIKGYDIIR